MKELAEGSKIWPTAASSRGRNIPGRRSHENRIKGHIGDGKEGPKNGMIFLNEKHTYRSADRRDWI